MTFVYKTQKNTLTYYNELYTEKNLYWLHLNLASLLKIHKDCKQKNIPFIVLYFPMLYKLKDDYPFKTIHTFMKNFFKENNIDYIDLFDYFFGMNERELWVHPKDKHPNNKANSFVAEKTAKYLISLYLGKR